MWTVKEVSRLSGVSIRTLHHYDTIGLLKPTAWTQAGYRLYDEAALRRLQSILLLRELQFPLKEIKSILDDCGCDPAQALEHQICLLQLQRDRLDRLIDHAREIQKGGSSFMSFQLFDRSELERYRAEVKETWGQTEAYREYTEKNTDPQQEADAAAGMMAVFAQLGTLRNRQPEDPAVQAQIDCLREYISAHFYTCTEEILQGLGQMYVSDERFRRSIDEAGGVGTAELAARAIATRRK